MKALSGFASDLIEYDEQYRGIILSLLGKVVVVESLDAGIRMARKFGYGFRIVSLDGDILKHHRFHIRRKQGKKRVGNFEQKSGNLRTWGKHCKA